MTVENGHPYVFRNVQLEDGGVLTCELDGVRTQPSKSAPLNVYELSGESATVPVNNRSTAIIGCLVGYSTECPIVVNFFKYDVRIEVDGRKFTPSSYPYDNMTYSHYLMVRNVTAADVGTYECRVYTNCSRQEQIASQEVFIEKWLSTSTGMYTHAYAMIKILHKYYSSCNVFHFTHAVTTENDQLVKWQIGFGVALSVAIVLGLVAVILAGLVAFVSRGVKTTGTVSQHSA
jgi:hypothetical protein